MITRVFTSQNVC